MTDMRNDDKESSKERFNNGILSIHPVKGVCSDTNVLRPKFGGPLKRSDTNTATTHGPDVRQTTKLRNTMRERPPKNGETTDTETDPESQTETNLGPEDRSDPKEE